MPFILYDVVFFNRLPDTGINSLMSRGTEQPSKFLNDAMYPLMPNGLFSFKFVYNYILFHPYGIIKCLELSLFICLMSRATEQPSKFLNDAMYPLMSIGLLGFMFIV